MRDIIRVSCCVPEVALGNTGANIDNIKKMYTDASEKNADIAIFPECSITGCTCGDLFFQRTLLEASVKGLVELAEYTANFDTCMAVGLPFCVRDRVYDCSAVIHKGKILGIVPKTNLTADEKRWFSSAKEVNMNCVTIGDWDVPFGCDLLFDICGTEFAVEIGGDLYAPVSPSVNYALGGAHLILNMSAESEIIGNREKREYHLKSISSRLCCAYVYVSAGKSESTTDFVFSGHSVISESGNITAQNQGFIDDGYALTLDIDTEKIRVDRMRSGWDINCSALRTVKLDKAQLNGEIKNTALYKNPFVSNGNNLKNIFDMQAEALIKRLSVTGGRAVVGVSGGLDSTLALLVCAEAVKRMGNTSENVVGITMPCFGTTDRTYNNSLRLMKALGVKIREIPIKDACVLHMKDIGHPVDVHDVTYENTQARERTQVLMDAANQEGAIVVGTGDLSELALGWCTYNADHMSMYGVNAGIPKTLIKWVIKSIIETDVFKNANEVLEDILDTPISPELLPPDKSGKIAQKTEDLVGPYELHDFFLYYVLRYGFSPKKIYEMAKAVFSEDYSGDTILKWLRTFFRRFFTQQFKRSCLPDGVKIFSAGISPRGDLRMPSDGSYAIWLKEIEDI